MAEEVRVDRAGRQLVGIGEAHRVPERRRAAEVVGVAQAALRVEVEEDRALGGRLASGDLPAVAGEGSDLVDRHHRLRREIRDRRDVPQEGLEQLDERVVLGEAAVVRAGLLHPVDHRVRALGGHTHVDLAAEEVEQLLQHVGVAEVQARLEGIEVVEELVGLPVDLTLEEVCALALRSEVRELDVQLRAHAVAVFVGAVDLAVARLLADLHPVVEVDEVVDVLLFAGERALEPLAPDRHVVEHGVGHDALARGPCLLEPPQVCKLAAERLRGLQADRIVAAVAADRRLVVRRHVDHVRVVLDDVVDQRALLPEGPRCAALRHEVLRVHVVPGGVVPVGRERLLPLADLGRLRDERARHGIHERVEERVRVVRRDLLAELANARVVLGREELLGRVDRGAVLRIQRREASRERVEIDVRRRAGRPARLHGRGPEARVPRNGPLRRAADVPGAELGVHERQLRARAGVRRDDRALLRAEDAHDPTRLSAAGRPGCVPVRWLELSRPSRLRAPPDAQPAHRRGASRRRRDASRRRRGASRRGQPHHRAGAFWPCPSIQRSHSVRRP